MTGVTLIHGIARLHLELFRSDDGLGTESALRIIAELRHHEFGFRIGQNKLLGADGLQIVHPSRSAEVVLKELALGQTRYPPFHSAPG